MTTNPSSILNRRTQLSLELFGVLASILLAIVVTGFFAHTPWPRGDDYLFYPPLSIYLGGLLTLLFGHYWAAPILCGMVMAVAAMSMRLCASLWLEPARAWVVALLCCANPIS